MRKSSPRTCANGAPVTTAVTASSSRSSRRSASAGVSPSSTCPPGRSQQSGYQCRVGARCTNRPRPPRSRSRQHPSGDARRPSQLYLGSRATGRPSTRGPRAALVLLDPTTSAVQQRQQTQGGVMRVPSAAAGSSPGVVVTKAVAPRVQRRRGTPYRQEPARHRPRVSKQRTSHNQGPRYHAGAGVDRARFMAHSTPVAPR